MVDAVSTLTFQRVSKHIRQMAPHTEQSTVQLLRHLAQQHNEVYSIEQEVETCGFSLSVETTRDAQQNRSVYMSVYRPMLHRLVTKDIQKREGSYLDFRMGFISRHRGEVANDGLKRIKK